MTDLAEPFSRRVSPKRLASHPIFLSAARLGRGRGGARAGPRSDERYQWKECQQTLFNIDGRLQPVRPGTVLEYEVPDWYDRPWARVWEQYFEQGMQRPEVDEDIFDFE